MQEKALKLKKTTKRKNQSLVRCKDNRNKWKNKSTELANSLIISVEPISHLHDCDGIGPHSDRTILNIEGT